MSAQSNLASSGYSPYSLYGFGDIARPGTTYNLSMGGIGIGDRNVRVINMVNPAAITARELKSFMMDFGVENRNILYQGNAATSLSETASGVMKSANNTFNMHHIVATLPIASKGAFKMGLMPYSSIGYKFNAVEKDDKLIAEMGDIQYGKTGEGSLYQAFLGVGVTLWNHLSLGVDGQYYFGNLSRTSTAIFTTNSSFRTISSGWKYNISCFGAKAGLQYTQPLNNRSSLTIGATYQLPTQLRGGETRYAYGESSSETDTIVNNVFKINDYKIPGEIGAGITYRYTDQFMIGVDYTTQDWTGMTFEGAPGIDFIAGRSQNIRAGFEITPNRYDIRYFLKRVTYRGGFYHENSYMTLNGSPVVANGITLGISLPVFRYYNSINFGIDMGQRGTLDNNLIRERYFLFTLSFSLHDIWFIKNLYQ